MNSKADGSELSSLVAVGTALEAPLAPYSRPLADHTPQAHTNMSVQSQLLNKTDGRSTRSIHAAPWRANEQLASFTINSHTLTDHQCRRRSGTLDLDSKRQAKSTFPSLFGSPPLLSNMTAREVEVQREMTGHLPSQFILEKPATCLLMPPSLRSCSAKDQRIQVASLSSSEHGSKHHRLLCTQAATTKTNSYENSSRNVFSDPVITSCCTDSKSAESTRDLSTQLSKLGSPTTSNRSASPGLQKLCQHGNLVFAAGPKKRLYHEACSSQSDPASPKLADPIASKSRDCELRFPSPLAPVIDHSRLSDSQKRARSGLRGPRIETADRRMLNQRSVFQYSNFLTRFNGQRDPHPLNQDV